MSSSRVKNPPDTLYYVKLCEHYHCGQRNTVYYLFSILFVLTICSLFLPYLFPICSLFIRDYYEKKSIVSATLASDNPAQFQKHNKVVPPDLTRKTNNQTQFINLTTFNSLYRETEVHINQLLWLSSYRAILKVRVKNALMNTQNFNLL